MTDKRSNPARQGGRVTVFRRTSAPGRNGALGAVRSRKRWNTRKPVSVIGRLGAMGLLMLFSVAAPSSAQSPVDVIRDRNEAVSRVLEAVGDSVDDATREQLKDVINGLIDFKELSRLALGRHWDARTDKEREDFVNVFRQLIRNSSVERLGVYRADSVTYRTPEISGDEATVETLAYRNGKSVEIVYKMHKVDGTWRAHDIIVDGSSTARTYRDSFNQQIAKSSFSEMYAKLVEKLERGA